MKNKIGWCNLTFNPTWGCRNKCPYCYARTFAKRFGGIRFIEEWKYRVEHNMDDVHFKLKNSLDLIEFKPTFLYSQFEKKFPKKPQRIFVGSMSEIAHWEKEWIEKVIEKVKEHPQYTFQFLTKHPEAYNDWLFPKNCWLGITINNSSDAYTLDNSSFTKEIYNIHFLSIEPILDYIPIDCIDFADWVIIGAETGNRKGKIIPKKEWIATMVEQLRGKNIPIYLKDSLKDIFPEEIKEFPKIN